MNFFKIFFATLFAMLVSSIAVIIFIVCLLAGVIVKSGVMTDVKNGSVLTIDLTEPITDTPELNPLESLDITSMSITPKLSLLEVLKSIERATYDDKIQGIYIKPSSSGIAPISIANLEEIRTAIAAFKKESGKFVVGYADTFSQGGYYLASIADKLYLQREGMVVWQGIAANSLYFKRLIDYVGVNIEVFRPEDCIFKSAVEPFIRDDMSPESRLQNQELINSLWSTITADVAVSRRITEGTLNRAASELSGFIASQAKESGLVDDLMYEDEVEDILVDLGAKRSSKGGVRKVPLATYISSNEMYETVTEQTTTHGVAVIYAEGTIVDGRGEMGDVGSSTMAKLLRRARTNDEIKAVVVRVNSPGGSALASDVIWREMSLLRDEKPLIVSMGAYAASGGYYMSAPADAIIADKLTVTGSIGVYGMLTDYQRALSQHLGINSDGVKSNPSADFMRASRPITATERAVMMRSVDQVYETFIEHVSDGRNMTPMNVNQIAKGRVWSGADALNIGLVDGTMGLKGAILMAASRAGVEDKFDIVEILDTPTGLAQLFAPVATKISSITYSSELKALDQKGINTYSPIRISWR